MDQLLTIRRAFPEDAATVLQIGTETFVETFAESNTKEDLAKYLADHFNDYRIREELSNPESFFFLACEDEMIVGYLKVNTGKSQTELKDEVSLEIERIYVKQAYHGKKVGQLLYDKALEIACQLGKTYIWLGVWEENAKAIRFYGKNGFVVFDKHIFRMGDDEQTDLMMKKLL